MSTSEEKIKAFFSDEEKVKKLMSDEEFIEKVSGGTATTEIYTEEFKKLGLELSNDECEKVKAAVSNILDTPVEELKQDSLKHISGGLSGHQVESAINLTGTVLTKTSILSGMCCVLASAVYASKAQTSAQKGETKKAESYSKTAKNLAISAASLSLGVPLLTKTVTYIGGRVTANP